MKLITRGYGANQQIITRGYGGIVAAIVAVVEQAHGAAAFVIKETLTFVRFDVDHLESLKLRFHIGKFELKSFSVLFHSIKQARTTGFNLLVHHFDIQTRQLISTIRTAIATIGLNTKDENIS